MLFTRCPECTTTFRVSDEALKKANGQVRCGRCASVFNALVEQVGRRATEAPPVATAPQAVATPPPEPAPAVPEPPSASAADVASEPLPSPGPPPQPSAVEAQPHSAVGEETPRPHAPPPEPPPTVPRDAGAASIGASSFAAAVPEAEPAAATAAEATPISSEHFDEVLTESTDTPLLAAEPTWIPAAAPRAPASRWWTAGAALAVAALGLQITNHYRGTLAGHPVFGQWTQRAYALVGIAVVPHWDVRQYEVLDWVANAVPNARGVGSLKISARIQNRGPQEQPYPQVQLRLKDRWEKAVGGRVFTPSEYLSHDAPHASLMAAGETAHAEIELVDPGPDAYGFELDVCIEVEAQRLTCRGDKVYL